MHSGSLTGLMIYAILAPELYTLNLQINRLNSPKTEPEAQTVIRLNKFFVANHNTRSRATFGSTTGTMAQQPAK